MRGRPALPPTFRITVDPGVRRIDDTVLAGGSPLRLLRLTPAGLKVIDAFESGQPIGTGTSRAALARRLLDAGMAHPVPSTPDPLPSVAVVIPVRDDAAGLGATLTGVAPLEPVVVDDGSRTVVDGALRHDRARGPAAARNTGWHAATADVIAFADAGCAPRAGWLDRLLPHFADPAVAAVAPRIVVTPGADLLTRYDARRGPLDQGPAPSIVRPGARVTYVPSACLLVRRDVLEQLGGFDESMRYGEDVDLVWRIVDAGHTVRYEPAATVEHPRRPTATAWLRQRFDYGTSAAPLARRHGRAVAPLRVSSWSAASWALVGAGRPGTGAAVVAATTALLPRKLRALRHPAAEAARIAGVGHLLAGRQIATAVRRAWWPAALVAAGLSRTARRAVASAFLVPLAAEWIDERPPIDPACWVALRLADDVAYGAGVWAGCWRERSLAALVPDLADWPGHNDQDGSGADPTIETNETISPG